VGWTGEDSQRSRIGKQKPGMRNFLEKPWGNFH
jgi:hypothetical protein